MAAEKNTVTSNDLHQLETNAKTLIRTECRGKAEEFNCKSEAITAITQQA